MLCKNALQECFARMLCKNALQECFARMLCKNALKEMAFGGALKGHLYNRNFVARPYFFKFCKTRQSYFSSAM
jgi:hypothetical protein